MPPVASESWVAPAGFRRLTAASLPFSSPAESASSRTCLQVLPHTSSVLCSFHPPFRLLLSTGAPLSCIHQDSTSLAKVPLSAALAWSAMAPPALLQPQPTTVMAGFTTDANESDVAGQHETTIVEQPPPDLWPDAVDSSAVDSASLDPTDLATSSPTAVPTTNAASAVVVAAASPGSDSGTPAPGRISNTPVASSGVSASPSVIAIPRPSGLPGTASPSLGLTVSTLPSPSSLAPASPTASSIPMYIAVAVGVLVALPILVCMVVGCRSRSARRRIQSPGLPQGAPGTRPSSSMWSSKHVSDEIKHFANRIYERSPKLSMIASLTHNKDDRTTIGLGDMQPSPIRANYSYDAYTEEEVGWQVKRLNSSTLYDSNTITKAQAAFQVESARVMRHQNSQSISRSEGSRSDDNRAPSRSSNHPSASRDRHQESVPRVSTDRQSSLRFSIDTEQQRPIIP
ncbi:uncharacterized protein BJ171DRAFT_70217 [Polychytrium aggregatum]|uniref:uncharacterized protein n=1 Tax=Polychytrium aggregatum TaxID=110093 RepID=UPI0022FE9592|nr:uncharacterized protein BJ171DRAFT_70217 [Polychytrium aggregatum]KAI9205235.1 hypothetical protein BJ171DRAFT_70217 [Polychytrium aggregatum]